MRSPFDCKHTYTSAMGAERRKSCLVLGELEVQPSSSEVLTSAWKLFRRGAAFLRSSSGVFRLKSRLNSISLRREPSTPSCLWAISAAAVSSSCCGEEVTRDTPTHGHTHTRTHARTHARTHTRDTQAHGHTYKERVYVLKTHPD